MYSKIKRFFGISPLKKDSLANEIETEPIKVADTSMIDESVISTIDEPAIVAVVDKETSVKELSNKYENTLRKAIELGLKGKLVLIPDTLWISSTSNCNLQCIMCMGKGERDNYYITAEEIEKILPEDINNESTFGTVKRMDLTSGEPLMNPDVHHVVKHFKQLFPNAVVTMCSNTTLPIKGNIKEALQFVDRIGVSIDGVTKETYEFIRQGADFYKVLQNIRDLVDLKGADKIDLLFVAMTINLHQIPGLVKLAHFYGIKNIFVQKVEARSWLKYDIEQYLLSNLPNEEICNVVNEAQEEARRLGITISFGDLYSDTPSLKEEPDVPNNVDHISAESEELLENEESDVSNNGDNDSDISKIVGSGPKESDILMKMCKIPWTTSPYIRKDQNGIHPEVVCCHMPHGGDCSLIDRDNLRNVSIKEIFNSKECWDVRSRLINGELLNTACSGCQYYNMTAWTEEELKDLASYIENISK